MDEATVNDIETIEKHNVGRKDKKEYDEAMQLFGLFDRKKEKKL